MLNCFIIHGEEVSPFINYLMQIIKRFHPLRVRISGFEQSSNTSSVFLILNLGTFVPSMDIEFMIPLLCINISVGSVLVSPGVVLIGRICL